MNCLDLQSTTEKDNICGTCSFCTSETWLSRFCKRCRRGKRYLWSRYRRRVGIIKENLYVFDSRGKPIFFIKKYIIVK
jgi:hypothetical protein